MKKFKVGDLVYLSEFSQFWEDCSTDFKYQNPRDTLGIIAEIKERSVLRLTVNWINGQENTYDSNDLKCANEYTGSEEADILRMLHGV